MTELLEIWKPIKGFEGLYEISNLGRVKTIGRKAKNGTFFPTKLLKLKPNKMGYILVALHKDGKIKRVGLHRLVAIHFIPNPNNYQIVNHLDRNPSNCRVDNLEWCTQSHNCRWDGALERRAKAQINRKDVSNLVNQYTLDGEFVMEWQSLAEIQRTLNYNVGNICKHIKGQFSQMYGYIWRYAV